MKRHKTYPTHRLASVNDNVSSDILAAAAADDVVMVTTSRDTRFSALCKYPNHINCSGDNIYIYKRHHSIESF